MPLHKYTVRPGNLMDAPWCVEVAAYRSITEDAKRPELVNKERWYELSNLVDKEGVSFIALDGEERVGFLFGFITPHIFNDEYKTLTVFSWYILPEYRRTRVAALLLKNLEEEAKVAGVDRISFSLLNSESIKDSSLERLGYSKTEVCYSRDIKNGN